MLILPIVDVAPMGNFFGVQLHGRFPSVKYPRKGTRRSAGYDLFAARGVTVPSSGQSVIPTGIRWHIPEHHFVFVVGCSSLSFRGLHVVPGVVDEDYTGCTFVIIHNINKDPVEIKLGEKIAQAILIPVYPGELHWLKEGTPNYTILERYHSDFTSVQHQFLCGVATVPPPPPPGTGAAAAAAQAVAAATIQESVASVQEASLASIPIWAQSLPDPPAPLLPEDSTSDETSDTYMDPDYVSTATSWRLHLGTNRPSMPPDPVPGPTRSRPGSVASADEQSAGLAGAGSPGLAGPRSPGIQVRVDIDDPRRTPVRPAEPSRPPRRRPFRLRNQENQ